MRAVGFDNIPHEENMDVVITVPNVSRVVFVSSVGISFNSDGQQTVSDPSLQCTAYHTAIWLGCCKFFGVSNVIWEAFTRLKSQSVLISVWFFS